VGRARRLVRDAVARRLSTEQASAAELLVSELVTNALVHAGTAIRLSLSFGAGDVLRVAVEDGSPHHPAPQHSVDTAGTGRGLRLLEELADDWGVDSTATGKTVWFEVAGAGPHPHAPRSSRGRPEPADPAGTVTVELVDLPGEVHTPWQDDVRALLREYLLLMLEEDTSARQVQAHAACSDAVSRLAEAVEAAAEGRAPSDALRVTLSLPRASVPHFTTLDQVLDRAVLLADRGGTLTPATSPRGRAFRRWVCRQVAEQAQGKPPAAWTGG
jgi:anti-sigma regulatory factor (Ser/Thr protein kinase)